MHTRSIPRNKAIPAITLLLVLMSAAAFFVFQATTTSAQSLAVDSSLPKPTGLTATADSANIVLNWTAPSGQVDGYQIERRLETAGTFLEVIVNNTRIDATTYTDESITAPGTYVYRVRLVRNDTVSKRSNHASALVTRTDVQNALNANAVTPEEAAETERTEVERLNQLVTELARGCVAVTVDNPDGSGETYLTNSDNAACVKVREIVVDTCITSNNVYHADNLYATVAEENSNRYLLSTYHTLPIEMSEQSWYPTEDGRLPSSININADNFLYDSAPLARVSYRYGNQTNLGNFDYETNTFSEYGHTMAIEGKAINFVLQRITDILEGNDYRSPANCAFTPGHDERDAVVQIRNGELAVALTDGTPVTGYLDNGPDTDLFGLDMTADTEYHVYAYALPKDSLDYDAVPIDDSYVRDQLGVTNVTDEARRQAMGEAAITMRVLDADGNEVSNPGADVSASFTPDTTGTYYLEVSHESEGGYDNIGTYAVVAFSDQADDQPATTTTHGRLNQGEALNANIADADDVDWFRFDADADQLYVLRIAANVAGETPDFKPLLNGIYDTEEADASSSYTITQEDGVAQADISLPETGTYYIAVEADDSGTGDYTIEIVEDDYTATHESSRTQLGDLRYGTASGMISTGWDKDTFIVDMDNVAENYFTVTAEPDADGNVPALRISLEDAEPHSISEPIVNRLSATELRTGIQFHPLSTEDEVPQGYYTISLLTVESDGPFAEGQQPIAYTVNYQNYYRQDVPVTDDHPNSADDTSIDRTVYTIIAAEEDVITLTGALNGLHDTGDVIGIVLPGRSRYRFDAEFAEPYRHHWIKALIITSEFPDDRTTLTDLRFAASGLNSGVTVPSTGFLEGSYLYITSDYPGGTSMPYTITITRDAAYDWEEDRYLSPDVVLPPFEEEE